MLLEKIMHRLYRKLALPPEKMFPLPQTYVFHMA